MKEMQKELLRNYYWFLIWALIYVAIYFVAQALLPKLFGNAHFFQVKLLYFIIFGLFFSICSRIIHSLIHNKRIHMSSEVFFFWTCAYAFAIWFSEFLRDYFVTDLNVIFFANKFVGVLFVGVSVCLIIKLIKRMEFGKLGVRSPLGKAPSQVFTGIVLIVLGVLCWRFSTMVFIDWFNWTEGLGWSLLIGLALIIAGFLVLLAWWRNNVLQRRIGIKFW